MGYFIKFLSVGSEDLSQLPLQLMHLTTLLIEVSSRMEFLTATCFMRGAPHLEELHISPARPTDPSTKCLWKYMEVNKRYSRCVEAVQHAINSGMVGQQDKPKDLLEKRNNVNLESSSVAKELFEFSTIEVYDKKEIEAVINFKSIFIPRKRKKFA